MAASEEHGDFVKHFLSKNENTICDLSDIFRNDIQNRDALVYVALNAFVRKKE